MKMNIGNRVRGYYCIVYLALIIGLIAGNIVESNEPTVVTENLWDPREIYFAASFTSSVLTSSGSRINLRLGSCLLR